MGFLLLSSVWEECEDQSSMSPGQTLAESTRRDHREEEREGLQGENEGEL